MEVEKHMHGAVTVIALSGELDSRTAGQAQDEITELVPEQGSMLLDLSRMSYMSSAGLRVLLLVHRQAERGGVRLALTGVREELREIMEATGFLEFFVVTDTVESGVEALSG